jgi:hypothetical protein
MQNEQHGKLELLVRRTKGRMEHPYYATELSHVLKTEMRPVDVLSLEETDRLFFVIVNSQLEAARNRASHLRRCGSMSRQIPG